MTPPSVQSENHANPEAPRARPSLAIVLGIFSAMALLAILLLGGIGLIQSAIGPAPLGKLSALEGNWLVVLFRMNIPGSGVEGSSLVSLNPLDLAIMLLFAILSATLSVALRETSRTLWMIAVSLALLGIPVFLVTATAGRSAVLVSSLLLSIAGLRRSPFGRRSATIGIAASGLLFFGGDIATAILPSSVVVAAIIGAGYVLWMIWLLSITVGLIRLSFRRGAPDSG